MPKAVFCMPPSLHHNLPVPPPQRSAALAAAATPEEPEPAGSDAKRMPRVSASAAGRVHAVGPLTPAEAAETPGDDDGGGAPIAASLATGAQSIPLPQYGGLAAFLADAGRLKAVCGAPCMAGWW